MVTVSTSIATATPTLLEFALAEVVLPSAIVGTELLDDAWIVIEPDGAWRSLVPPMYASVSLFR